MNAHIAIGLFVGYICGVVTAAIVIAKRAGW